MPTAMTVECPTAEPAPASRRLRSEGLPRLAAVVGLGLLLVIAGIANGGIGGGLIMAGLVVGGVGLTAVIAGHARWALVATRRAGIAVTAAGLTALIVGGVAVPSKAVASRTPVAVPSSTLTASTPTASPSPTVDTEASGTADRDSTGLLPDDATNRTVGSAAPRSALAALAALEVKGRAPKTGYSRDQFGSGWVDTDHNGCDTRDDILARDLTDKAFKPGTHDCVVLRGSLADPYSGTTIAFVRGQVTSTAVQIDHVVALSDAWQKGAQTWGATRRVAFANDPLNLLAVDGPLNEQKGDGDTATWLPPNRGDRCAYVARQVAVKVSYGLWVTQPEKNAMATVLSTCPNERLPLGVVADIPQPAPTTPAPAPAPVSAPAPDVYYANCAVARAAGAAPLLIGQPGYRPALDRDRDGVACET